MEKAMRIAVVGTGYVGLVSGACLAELGFETWCIDQDAAKIANLTRGAMPLFQAHLAAVVVSNHQSGRLPFATAMAETVRQADVGPLPVGPPDNREGNAKHEP